LIALRW